MDTARRRLFYRLPRGSNLETEIAVVRASLTELQQVLNEGQIYINVGTADDCRAVLVQDLINKNMAILNGLIRTQVDNHPERKIGGNLTITVNVTGQPSLQDVDESLDADQPQALPPGEQTVTAEPVQRDKFAELDE